MAKIKSPLMGHAASGSIGENLTFSHWKGRAYARQKTTPKNPSSLQQSIARELLGFCGHAWANSLSQVDRDSWTPLAIQKNLLPINIFIGENMTDSLNNFSPHKHQGQTPGGVDPSFAVGPTAIGGVGLITLGWQLAALNDGWGLALFAAGQSPTTPVTQFAPIATLDAALTPQSLNTRRLPPDLYDLTIATFTSTGQLGNPQTILAVPVT